MNEIPLNKEQEAMLRGEHGLARQMGMRLVLDLATAAGSRELVPVQSAHVSGVSPLTGGLGLRHFLRRLAGEAGPGVAVPTTLNSAGCDAGQFQAMRITAPQFLEQSQEIIELYTRLGIRPTQSCIPYEWEGVVTKGVAAWAESNAICFGNSYCGLRTNRESGLSALAAALTGYTPGYGLLEEEGRRPNLRVKVDCPLDDPADFSILGDWIGRQRQPSWHMPFGPIPAIEGLPASLNHEQRKALAAAAANYGCALLYLAGQGPMPPPAFQAELTFTSGELASRYRALRPAGPISLVVIGCPQASLGELRAVAAALKGKRVTSAPGEERPPLWLFTSAANLAVAERTGLAQAIRAAGALLLANTCPEVVPYDRGWVKRVLTNSMKAEHYIRSGLNGIPTAVMRLDDCLAVASGEQVLPEGGVEGEGIANAGTAPAVPGGQPEPQRRMPATGPFQAHGLGLPSQADFRLEGEAFVSEMPITFLGFVNRQTGVIEEPGHPAHGQSLAGKVAIFPRGTGSTVAPYVLLELHYRGQGPLAVVNTAIDQQSVPACSLEGIPYAYGFSPEIVRRINPGDTVRLERRGERVTLAVLARAIGV